MKFIIIGTILFLLISCSEEPYLIYEEVNSIDNLEEVSSTKTGYYLLPNKFPRVFNPENYDRNLVKISIDTTKFYAPQQTKGTCLFACIRYLYMQEKVMKSDKEIMHKCLEINPLLSTAMASDGGVDPLAVPAVLDCFLFGAREVHPSNFSDLIHQIESGRIYFYLTREHMKLIVGYNRQNDCIIYLDPTTGKLMEDILSTIIIYRNFHLYSYFDIKNIF